MFKPGNVVELVYVTSVTSVLFLFATSLFVANPSKGTAKSKRMDYSLCKFKFAAKC